MTTMTRSRASLQDRRGFTLIELLVVVAIIGLLAAFAIPALQRAMLRSRVGRMGNDAKTLYKAFVQYNVDVHSYPPESGGDEALDRKTLEPLVRRGYLKEGQSVLATFQGRELSEYRSVDAGSDDDQFYALARLGSLPTVEVVIGDTDQFPGFEGQTIEGAYFVHGGALYALDDDILQKLGK